MIDQENTPSERLKILCETYFGGNKSKMGKALDVSYQNINNYLEKGKKPSFEVMQKAYSIFADKINSDWLILGDGEMFRSNIANPYAPSKVETTSDNNLDLNFNNLGVSKQLFEYQSMIIELQQKVIRSLEK